MQTITNLQNTLIEFQYMITNTIDPVFSDLQNGSHVFDSVVNSHNIMIVKIDEMISYLKAVVINDAGTVSLIRGIDNVSLLSGAGTEVVTYRILYTDGTFFDYDLNNYVPPPVVIPPIVTTHLGKAFDFSIFATGGVTVAGVSSANWFVGGIPALSGVHIGSVEHYGDELASTVAIDIKMAYDYYKSLSPVGLIYLGASPVATSPIFAGDIAGVRFTAGVYSSVAAVTNSINVEFDALGDPDAVFVIQLGAAFAPAAGSTVSLLNGAKSSNVFWISTGAVSVGAGAKMKGTILSVAAIGFGAGASLEGRALTFGAGAVTISANVIETV